MEKYLYDLLDILIVIFFLFISKRTADFLTKFDDDDSVEIGANSAVALWRFGQYFGMAIAMSGLLGTETAMKDIPSFFLNGALVTLLFFLSHYINRYLFLKGIDNNKLIGEGNAAVGMVNCGIYLASGLVLNGVLSGGGGGLLSAIVFFALAQCVIALIFLITQKIYQIGIKDEIAGGNLSAGVFLAGVVISYAVILRSSVSGDFIGWERGIISFFVSAFVGLAFLFVIQKVADAIFLPKTTLSEQIIKRNTAAVTVVEAISLSVAIVIARIM
ncbi:DUF350 domain-containing protein [Candidatus Magnetominusculus xianensis]|uniref:Membrane protein n=1 Tax=Candidatus Magnetominusculus xianensis TaxID=1748249 RepID=A0ABR5SFA5_9BACT|nr:DUF350 domain-containing protein [Candidatus Magnetominusculus xianensis]KWT85571.1 putative membrane protein [Candidatus Magnetominusculus xianensis]MBF0404198.1 DUF350 domain-containing protein [Nitrospirota bacterium]